MQPQEKLGLDGKINLLFLLGVVLAVLLSGLYPLGTVANIGGVPLEAQNVLRGTALLGLAWLSLRHTCRKCRELNGFSWGPIEEVAQLFNVSRWYVRKLAMRGVPGKAMLNQEDLDLLQV